jgi:hypothetical protein
VTATFVEVRDALASAASECGINFQVYPDDAFDAPGGYVTYEPFDPRLVFSGAKVTVTFRLWVCAVGVDPPAAGLVLDGLMDPFATTGVTAAVQDEANWPDDLVDYAQVVQVGAFTEVRQNADSRVFGVPIDVEVCW